jgi:hypothetical protein
MSATETAQVLSELVADADAVPTTVAADLHELLSASLAERPAAATRFDRLSLLVELIVARDGLIPTTAEYERARQERGSDAPAASTLISAYGHWLRVINAASRVLSTRPMKQLRATHKTNKPAYTPRECAAAIARFHRRFDAWPSEWEYEQWAQLSRADARRCGAPDPRLPGGPAIRRCYGTFDRALRAARTTYER